MKKFTISLVQTIGGTAYVEANSLEEAESEAQKGNWYGYQRDCNFNDIDEEDDLIFGAVLFDDEDNEYV